MAISFGIKMISKFSGLLITILGIAVALVSICMFATSALMHPEVEMLPAEKQLTRVGEAMEKYARANRKMPPVCLKDKSGRKILSWRVALLPYLGYHDLYKKIDFSIAWNEGSNAVIASQCPEVYLIPGEVIAAGKTRVVAVCGKDTVWPLDAPYVFGTNERYQNCAVLVIAPETVNWMAPDDLDVGDQTDMSVVRKRLSGNGGNTVVAMIGVMPPVVGTERLDVSDADLYDLIHLNPLTPRVRAEAPLACSKWGSE